jgi:hypothetical protein
VRESETDDSVVNVAFVGKGSWCMAILYAASCRRFKKASSSGVRVWWGGVVAVV